jgi:hypothetical protein
MLTNKPDDATKEIGKFANSLSVVRFSRQAKLSKDEQATIDNILNALNKYLATKLTGPAMQVDDKRGETVSGE